MMHTRHLCCILLMAICRMGLSCHASSLYSHPDNPYAVTHIQDAYGAHYNFHWDDNGNLVNSHTHATHTDRRLCWTEDEAAQSERRASLLAFPSQSSVGVANRLQAFMERGDEGGIAAYYNYSADGERNIKLTSPRLNIQCMAFHIFDKHVYRFEHVLQPLDVSNIFSHKSVVCRGWPTPERKASGNRLRLNPHAGRCCVPVRPSCVRW